MKQKRQHNKIKTEPQQRKIYDTKYNFHNMTEEEKKLRKQELKTYYNSKYNEKRKIKKKEEQQERIKENGSCARRRSSWRPRRRLGLRCNCTSAWQRQQRAL